MDKNTTPKKAIKKTLKLEAKRTRRIAKDAVSIVMKKGNIWALAVGVLIGSAFGAVVNSLANDIIMQPIAKLTGFNDVAAMTAGGVHYGKFISALISFLIVLSILIATTFAGLYIWRSMNIKKELAKLEAEESAKNNPPQLSVEEKILLELQELNKNIKKQNK